MSEHKQRPIPTELIDIVYPDYYLLSPVQKENLRFEILEEEHYMKGSNYCSFCRERVELQNGECSICNSKAKERGELTHLETILLYRANKINPNLLSKLEIEMIEHYNQRHPKTKALVLAERKRKQEAEAKQTGESSDVRSMWKRLIDAIKN